MMIEAAEEVWCHVVGFEGVYEISSAGRVRRVLSSSGTFVGRILRPQYRNPAGYPSVCLYRNQIGYFRFLHHLVAEAFLGPRPIGKEINHKDGNKKNPDLTNLEYVSPSQNRKHAVDTGLLFVPPERRARGQKIGVSKLSPEQVDEIIKHHAEGTHVITLARRYGVSRQTIWKITTRQTWKGA
jgi:HNH endonuclease/NUMOD4 motif/Helix-turn-helix domain of resolvase